MKIVVNDIAASSGGALTILKQFYEYILHNCSKDEWYFLLSSRYLPETSNIKVRIFPKVKRHHFVRILFDLFYGRFIINRIKPDVFVSFQNFSVFGVKGTKLLYIHQSIPFQNEITYSLLKRKEFKLAFTQKILGKLICFSAKRASHVFVQTEWMAKSVAQKAKIHKSKISIIRPSFPFEEKKQNTSKVDRSFLFFYPSNNELYKNVDFLLSVFKELASRGYNEFKLVLTLPTETIQDKNIICVGYINKEQMASYYNSSTLLFPSSIETIGLPLLEACRFNSFIICNDTEYAHETLKGYGNVIFHKLIIEEWIQSILSVAKNTHSFNKNFMKNIFFENSDEWHILFEIIKKYGH